MPRMRLGSDDKLWECFGEFDEFDEVELIARDVKSVSSRSKIVEETRGVIEDSSKDVGRCRRVVEGIGRVVTLPLR